RALGARDASRTDDGQADGAQVKLADPAGGRRGRRGLLLGVQAVAGHKAVLADPVDQAAAELIRGGASPLATLLSGAHLLWPIMTSSIPAAKLSGSTSASERNVSVRCTPLIWKIFASSNSRRCAWSLTLSRTSRSRPPVTTLMSSASGMARIARMISLRSIPGPAVTRRYTAPGEPSPAQTESTPLPRMAPLLSSTPIRPPPPPAGSAM